MSVTMPVGDRIQALRKSMDEAAKTVDNWSAAKRESADVTIQNANLAFALRVPDLSKAEVADQPSITESLASLKPGFHFSIRGTHDHLSATLHHEIFPCFKMKCDLQPPRPPY